MYLEVRKGKLTLLILCKVVFKHPNKDADKCDPSEPNLGFLDPLSIASSSSGVQATLLLHCVFLGTPREDGKGSQVREGGVLCGRRDEELVFKWGWSFHLRREKSSRGGWYNNYTLKIVTMVGSVLPCKF